MRLYEQKSHEQIQKSAQYLPRQTWHLPKPTSTTVKVKPSNKPCKCKIDKGFDKYGSFRWDLYDVRV
jgi:hypothetical protein